MSSISNNFVVKHEFPLKNSLSGASSETSYCEMCKKTTQKVCKLCKTTSYCSNSCRKIDWKRHKLVCKNQKFNEEKKLGDQPGNVEPDQSVFHSKLSKIKATYINPALKDYPVYAISNEDGEDQALKALKLLKSTGKLFIGTGALSNLNLASVINNINHIIIFDPSSNVRKFWNDIIPLIKSSSGKEDCRKRIHDYLKNDCVFDSSSTSAYNESELQSLEKSTSWLSDDIRYTKIMKIFKESRFLHLPFDLTDFKVTEKVKDSTSLKSYGEFVA